MHELRKDYWKKQEAELAEKKQKKKDNNTLKIVLPKPHPAQELVLNSTAKWRVMCCGRRFGKSFICFILALETMLKGKSVAYVTPIYSLGEEFFQSIQEYIPEEIITERNKASLYLKLSTGGSIRFFSGEATRGIRGREYHRVIVDEAAFIPDLEYHWTQVILPTMATTNGDAIFVSTPNGQNYFHALFQKGKYKEEGFESFHFPSSESPFVSKEFLETVRKTMSEDAFRQEYLAEPLSSVGNPFGIDHIKKNQIEILSTKETVAFGIDVAKYQDYTVIIGLDEDASMSYFDRYRGEWSVTKEKIKALPANTLKAMDSTGVGDVIFEELYSTVPNIQGFKFSSSSKPQLMKELIVDVQSGRLKYNSITADEMAVFEYTLTATGYPKYQAQSGFHDDCVCALAIANRYQKQSFSLANWQLYSI